jgi:hypothetical protein
MEADLPMFSLGAHKHGRQGEVGITTIHTFLLFKTKHFQGCTGKIDRIQHHMNPTLRFFLLHFHGGLYRAGQNTLHVDRCFDTCCKVSLLVQPRLG